ncbi:Exodeoxyribonuclease VII small subunit [Bowdeniella nasicola]|uniref:Exodeoxyribonuclease 7 small subunit n=1 Tax=Bowdeniella nasicola TaxID=208480 RepID=A0A1H4A2E5_9ACTO|nr:Exodeoxyribonuclease VII small subunit [Bowdeniella nasicola]
MTDQRPDIASLGYEQARDELVRVVQQLESGGAGLEESLQLWERGEALANRCEEWLAGARERLAEAKTRRDQPEDSTEERS